MVDGIDELAVRRFDKIDGPENHSPVTALDVAKKWILDQPDDERPDHVIVLVGRSGPENTSGTRYFQAGSYRYHAMIGLCAEGAHMIRESACD